MESKIQEGYTLLVKKKNDKLIGLIVKKEEDIKYQILNEKELSYFDILPVISMLLDQGKIIRVYQTKGFGFYKFEMGLKKKGKAFYENDYLEVFNEGKSAFFMQALFNLEDNILKGYNKSDRKKIYRKIYDYKK